MSYSMGIGETRARGARRVRRRALSSAASLLLISLPALLATPAAAQEGGIAWKSTPGDGNWSTGSNWTTGTAPVATDTPQFNTSTITTLTLPNAGVTVAGLTFNAGAPAYTFNYAPASNVFWTLNGAGITNNSSNQPTINIIGGGASVYLEFTNNATAGNAIINVSGTNANGGVEFVGNGTSAGSATITAASGVIRFYLGASGGTSRIILNGGSLDLTQTTSGISIGSLEGTGGSVLTAGFGGSRTLTVGSLNTDTAFAGQIIEQGGTGKLVKVGTGTLTLSGTNTYGGGTTISSGTLQIGSGGTTGSISGNVTDNSTLAFNRSNAVTFAGVISGTGTLTQAGTGTLTLSATNTYSGANNIQSGLINFAAGSNLGTGAIIMNGGGLQWATGSTTDISPRLSLIGPGTFDTNGNNVTLATAISGFGSLTKSGAGTLTLSATNTYTGATTVSAGTLLVTGSTTSTTQVQSGGTLAGTGSVGALNLSGGILAPGNGGIGTLAVNGNLLLQSGITQIDVSLTSADKVTASGAAAINGGTLAATFANGAYTPKQYTLITSTGALSGTFTGLTTTNAPTGLVTALSYDANNVYLTLTTSNVIWSANPPTPDWSTAANWQGNAVPTATDPVIFDASTRTSVSVAQAANAKSIQFNNGAPAYTIAISGSNSGAASLTIANGGIINNSGQAQTITVGGVAGNLGTLNFNGSGTAADAIITAGAFGTVNFNGQTDASGNGVLTALAGGTFDFSGTSGILGDNKINAGALAGAGNFKLGGNTLTAGATSLSTTVSGVISGTGALIKTGTGGMTLSGTNTYSGGTTISGGTLTIGSGTSGSVVGNITDNAALTFGRSDNTTFAGVISGTGRVTQSGGGILTLSGVNTYSGGTTVSGGLINFAAGNNLGTGNITLSGGGLQWAAGNTTDISPRLTGLVGSGGTFDTNGNNVTLASAIGGGALTKTGAGTLTLSGNNTYAGTTTIIGGLINFAAGNNLGTGAITLNGGGLQWASGNTTDISSRLNALGTGGGTFDTNGNNVTLASVISGGALTKTGAGTLVLTGANTYSGTTTVSAGTLAIAADNSLGNGGTALVLGDGAILQITADGTYNTHTVNVGGAGTFNITTNNVVWQAPISDLGATAGQLVVTGGGTLTLAGANSYSGGTVVKGGTTLLIAGGTNLGSGRLTLGDATSAGTISTGNANANITQPITLAAGGGTIDAGFVTRITQAIDGTGPLTKTGNGTLALTAANAYSGPTTITAGALQVGVGTTGSITSNVTILATAALYFSRSDANTYGGVISGAGGVQQNGAGIVTLTGANTYSGITSILSPGTIRAGAAGTFSPNSAISLASGATLDLNSFNQTVGSITGAGNVTLGSAALTVNGGNSFAGVISGTGSLVKANSGTLILTGVNTYTGGTTINSGNTLQLGSGSTSGSILGNVTDNGTLIVNRSDGYTFAGVISGTGALTQQGTGTLILTGANTYSGSTIISAGTLQIGSGGTGGSILGNITDNGALAFNRSDTITFAGIVSGTGSLAQAGTGATLLTGTNTYSGGTTISAGTLQIGNGGTSGSIVGNVADNAALAFNRSDNITIGSVVSGTGSLTKLGNNVLTLTGTNTYTGGTIISAGTLQIGAGTAAGAITGNVTDNATLVFMRPDAQTFAGIISGSGAVTDNSAGALTLTGNSTFTGSTTINAVAILNIGNGGASGMVASDITDNGKLVFNRSGTVTYAGVISGTGSFTDAGAGILILTGNSTVSGGVTINSGATLQYGNGGTSGGITGNIVDNGALIINRSDPINASSVVSGTGSFTQAGTGTLTLTGNSTYSGATTVAAGTLSVNGSIANSSGVTVASGGTLGGTGTVASTTIQSGGTLAPGNSIGTLNVSGNLALASGSTTSMELSDIASDLVQISGTASLAGTLSASFATGVTYTPGKTYTLLTSTGLLSGSFSTVTTTNLPSQFLATVSYDAHNVFLTMTPADFIWSTTPVSTDWNNGANWKYGLVPGAGDIAQFDATNSATVVVGQASAAKSLQFNSGAPAYSLAVTGTAASAASLTISQGITNASSTAPTITVSGVSGKTGTLAFPGTGNAANAAITAGGFGTVSFAGNTD
ncbi:MAG: autotransporter-associated beta strand repeat-containing protein, partial [Alphaproteobacteria bacterium]|nr:autotransporter-associated beta strand repeat-containing protein [Alphaproteobacteria bacterium]